MVFWLSSAQRPLCPCETPVSSHSSFSGSSGFFGAFVSCLVKEKNVPHPRCLLSGQPSRLITSHRCVSLRVLHVEIYQVEWSSLYNGSVNLCRARSVDLQNLVCIFRV